MKKMLLSMALAGFAGAAFAAANDVLITFSTPGPDTYADGATVADGETYALCWSQDFSNFKITSGGEAVGGEIVLKAPVAKGGRCPTIVFEIDADYAAQKGYANGQWSVFLLDTRRFGANVPKVNTVGQVGGAVTVGTGTVASLTGASATTGTLADGVEVPQPEITGIRVADGYVYVTVKGTVPYLAYGLAEVATPGAEAEGVVDAQAGNADEEITIVTPAKAGGAFFKVQSK